MGDCRNERMGERGEGRGTMSARAAPALEPKTAALVRVAAAIAEGKIPDLKVRLAAAQDAGVPSLWIDEQLLLNLRALQPALEDLVLVDAYGKVIGRPGLDMKRRELCTVAAIAVLGTAQQLHSHLRGALNTGATVTEIEAVLGVIGSRLDPELRRRAWEQWEDVRRRKL